MVDISVKGAVYLFLKSSFAALLGFWDSEWEILYLGNAC
jgi:hypothetical protein